MRLRNLALITLTFAAALSCFQSPAEAEAANSKNLRIIGGEEIPTADSAVVQVFRRLGSSIGFCSGSILARRAVLTAFHCVARRPADMKVGIGARIFEVRAVRPHPDAAIDLQTQTVTADVALLFLRRATNRPKSSILVSSPVQVNDVLTIEGYGRDQFGVVGVLRRGITAVDQIANGSFSTIFDPATGDDTCNGDSGGPAIKTYTDASNIVRSGIVGVTSFGTSENCEPGDRTAYPNLQSPRILRFLQRRVRGLRVE